MKIKRKLWITLVLCLKLLCFSLLAEPLEFNQRTRPLQIVDVDSETALKSCERVSSNQRLKSGRCSNNRYITFLHNGGRGAKLKLNLNGQDVSVRRKECVRVSVAELKKASITIGKKEICKPEGEVGNCWDQFYESRRGGGVSYGYAINKLSAGVLGSPPYFYNYTLINSLEGCKEANDELR